MRKLADKIFGWFGYIRKVEPTEFLVTREVTQKMVILKSQKEINGLFLVNNFRYSEEDLKNHLKQDLFKSIDRFIEYRTETGPMGTRAEAILKVLQNV